MLATICHMGWWVASEIRMICLVCCGLSDRVNLAMVLSPYDGHLVRIVLVQLRRRIFDLTAALLLQLL